MAKLTQCSLSRRQRHRYNDNIDVGSDSMPVRARFYLVDLNWNNDCHTSVTHITHPFWLPRLTERLFSHPTPNFILTVYCVSVSNYVTRAKVRAQLTVGCVRLLRQIPAARGLSSPLSWLRCRDVTIDINNKIARPLSVDTWNWWQSCWCTAENHWGRCTNIALLNILYIIITLFIYWHHTQVLFNCVQCVQTVAPLICLSETNQ